MARYIENLNSCTDPTGGDYLWIVDASAGSTDKDRKVDVSECALTGVANSFTGAQPFYGKLTHGEAFSVLTLSAGNVGRNASGKILIVGRNNNAATPAAGQVRIEARDGTAYRIWPDNTGVLRIWTSNPTYSTDTSGTVVGAQTSSLDAKYLVAGMTSIEDVLAAVQQGAEAVRRFTYKSGAYNGEEFEGVVVDYAPRYGMDCDEEHEAGKSLNLINAVGDLLRAVAWLVEREQARA